MANRVPTAPMAKGSAHSWPGGADHADADKRGTPTRAEILPDMGVPSPRYQITGEGWRRLSCQPYRGHESPVGSLWYGSGSCQEPVRRDIKDDPNRHSQSCWPGPTPNQAIIIPQSLLSRFFSVHILSFPEVLIHCSIPSTENFYVPRLSAAKRNKQDTPESYIPDILPPPR